MTIYIVQGCCGEYSDRREWAVAAYADRDKAQRHAELAKQKADELYALYNRKRHLIPIGSNPYDDQMQTYFDGTDYSYYSVELREEVPTPAVN